MPIIGLGSKVIVITSSVKKGIGPRKGSIGYLSDVSMYGGYSNKISAYAQPIRVVFTRYGFESKTRKERKGFINILPVVHKDTTHGYAKIIENIDVNTLFWARMRESLASPNNKSKAAFPYGILVPLETDLMGCGFEEFFVWLESHILSKMFHKAIVSVSSNRERLSGIIDIRVIDLLLTITKSKELRNLWKDTIKESVDFRGLLIKTIRQITSIVFRRNSFDEASTLKYLMRTNPNGIGSILVDNYYVDSEYYWKSNLITKVNRTNKNALSHIERLTKMRKELKCLGQAYEEKMHVNNKT